MARRPTPVGTYGHIHVTEIRKKTKDRPAVHEAHARFRMADGSSKQIRARGASATKAEDALKEKMRDLADEVTGGEITKDTRFSRICDLWIEELEREYKLSRKSPTTPRLYKSYVKNWIKPALGELTAREVRAYGCNQLIQKGLNKSYDTAHSLRAALSGACSYAVRFGAMDVNPVASTARLAKGEKKEVKAMTLDQRLDLLEKLEQLAVRKQKDSKGRSLGRRSHVWQDLPDVMRAMLATGVRLGELLALDGGEVEPATPSIYIGHHLVRETGVGLLRLEYRKGKGKGLMLGVPQWSVPMWRRRKLASGGGPLFPSWTGTWSDPSNVINRIKEGMKDCGYGWVTSHIWRKTVATVLDEANLPTTAIADQLGNTPHVVETHYRAPRVANLATVAALETIMTRKDET